MISGKIAQIVGPVIDVEFDSESGLPKIYDSLEIDKADGTKLVLEVQAHIGENMVKNNLNQNQNHIDYLLHQRNYKHLENYFEPQMA